MKWLGSPWRRWLFIVGFFSCLAAILIAPISSGMVIPGLADYINHLAAIIQAKLALAEGQFPLRVAPLEQMGFRYPYYQFYSPSSFTFSALIYQWLTPDNPLTAFRISLWCALVVGGIYMYRLAYWLVQSRPAALLASVIYLTAPYYIIVLDHLGNLNEAMALGILPAVLYYTIQRYLYPASHKILLQVALAWYLLITIHIITFIYSSFFIGILLLGITLKNRRHWSNFLRVIIAYAFGCLLAMWFLTPIFMLKKYFVMSDTFSNVAHFADFSPLLSYLLSPTVTVHEVSNSALISIHPAVGWPILIPAAICSYVFFRKFHSKNKRADYWMPFLLLLFFIVFMLIWLPINFMYWLPKVLLVGQYSWRLLGQIIWIGALLAAWAISWVFNSAIYTRHAVFSFFVVMLAASPWFPVPPHSNMNLEKFIKRPLLIYNNNGYAINFNKYTQFVDNIDSMLLYSLMQQATLPLNTPYIIPQSLLKLAAAPFISIQGEIPSRLHQYRLIAGLNGEKLATYKLQPGLFRWDIPLYSLPNQWSLQNNFIIKISPDTRKTLIPITRVMLSGFMKHAETIDVKEIMPYCQQKKTITQCKIFVPSTVRLLELPILYYPKLLHITLNGHSVLYQSVLYQNNLIAAVTPQRGQINTIDIQFCGLVWANHISLCAWGLFVVISIMTAMLYLRRFFSSLFIDLG